MATITKLTLTTLLISLVTGCGVNATKDDILPQDGKTMKEVYREHEDKIATQDGVNPTSKEDLVLIKQSRPISDDGADLVAYTRDSQNEIQAIFPRLPNPTLVMYVYPHLSTGSRLPVPGYSTSFTMYEKPEYALTGEVTH